jgi:ribosome biogenesis GTPase
LRAHRVFARHRGHVLLDDDRLAPLAGRLRLAGADPVTGDWVRLDSGGAVAEVLPRRGVLARAGQVLLANVDHVLVAHAAAEDHVLHRLQRFLAVAADARVAATVLVTKADLLDDADAAVAAARAVTGGVAPVVPISAATGTGLDIVRALVAPGTTAALLGMSGAGKSTLVNALLGEERQATRAVRESDGRGRHVTVLRELVAIPGGGLVADTPGLRLVRVRGGVEEAFDDVERLAARCRFADCGHGGEPGCAVRAAIEAGELDVSRLDAAARLAREAVHWAAREDAALQRERRRRARAVQVAYRRDQRDRRAGR